MAGEEGSSTARTTRSKTKRAAKAAVSGGEEGSRTTERKAEESVRTTRRKAAGVGCSELNQGAASDQGGEEEAPAKKRSLLPQDEIDRILAREMNDERLPRSIRDLKRRNPDLIPSPEEELDEELMDLYEEARLIYKFREDIRGHHARVRREYQEKGYVEVEDDVLVRLEETKAWHEEFLAELAAGIIQG